MNREQAINYLISRGLTQEQVGDVVRALTYEPASLSVDEVTALAEWTEKLTKASEDAYNKGFADGANEVLDKIRVEIEQARQGYEASMDYTDGAREQELSWVLDVIDKYRAESEDK